MKAAPTCPRCRGPLSPPSAWTSAWVCAAHGDVCPFGPPLPPSFGGLLAVRALSQVPVWVPWPPPVDWLVTGFAAAGDERSGERAVAVALSGPAPLGSGPADMIIVAEEPGIGLGASFAGLPGPDPGAAFCGSAPDAKVHIDGRPVPLWAVHGPAAAFAGEARGNWLWVVLWPDTAGALMLEELRLFDLREADLDLPYGAPSPRLAGRP